MNNRNGVYIAVKRDGKDMEILPTAYIDHYEALAAIKELFGVDFVRKIYPENYNSSEWLELRNYEGGEVWSYSLVTPRDLH